MGLLTKPLPLTAAFPTGSAFRSPYFTRPSAPQGERDRTLGKGALPFRRFAQSPNFFFFLHAFSEELETHKRALICVQGHVKFGWGPSGLHGSQIAPNLQQLHGLKCPFPHTLNLHIYFLIFFAFSTLFIQSRGLISARETIYIWTSAAGPPSQFPSEDITQHPHTQKHPLSG